LAGHKFTLVILAVIRFSITEDDDIHTAFVVLCHLLTTDNHAEHTTLDADPLTVKVPHQGLG